MKISDRIDRALDSFTEWQVRMFHKAADAVPLAGMSVVAGFAGAGMVATGMAAASALGGIPVAAVAAVTVATVTGLTVAGSFAAARLLLRPDSGYRPGIVAAFMMAAVLTGAGGTAFVSSGGIQAGKEKTYPPPVGPELRRVLGMGLDRDRNRQVQEDIARYAEEKIRRNAALDFRICSENKEFYAKKDIRCDLYNLSSAPGPDGSPVP